MTQRRQYIDVTLWGARAIDSVMRELPRKVQDDVAGKVTRAGAGVFRREAKKNIRRNGSIDSGTLYRSIIVKKVKGTKDTFRIGADKSAPHAHLVEWGTSLRKLKNPKHIQVNGQWLTITHTGRMPAKPFLRPAVDTKQDEANKKMIEKFWKEINKVSANLNKKYSEMPTRLKRQLARS